MAQFPDREDIDSETLSSPFAGPWSLSQASDALYVACAIVHPVAFNGDWLSIIVVRILVRYHNKHQYATLHKCM